MDTSTPKIPTSGGSYERQGDGSLKLVHATQPAPPPVNRKSPDDPHLEAAVPADTEAAS